MSRMRGQAIMERSKVVDSKTAANGRGKGKARQLDMTIAISPSWLASAKRLDAGDARRLNRFLSKLTTVGLARDPGFQFERLTGLRDDDIWSVRVTQDLRAIVHKQGEKCVLLYVDHHDAALAWAARRDVHAHLVGNGLEIAMDFGSFGETDAPSATEQPSAGPGPALFSAWSDADLRELGVPGALLRELRALGTEDEFLALASFLPQSLCEHLIGLLVGDWRSALSKLDDKPEQLELRAPSGSIDASSIEARDAEAVALRPHEWWIAFADQHQAEIAHGSFDGPVLVTGVAGTGKTVVALHRARHLARQGRKVLLATYTIALCDFLRSRLGMLCSEDELSNIDVVNVDGAARALVPATVQGEGCEGLGPYDSRCRRAVIALESGEAASPYDCVIVDEAQDLGPHRLAFVARLPRERNDGLMLLGDMGQRIFGQAFDLEDLGVDVAGRTFDLSTVYRVTRRAHHAATAIAATSPGSRSFASESTALPVVYVDGEAPQLHAFDTDAAQAAWHAVVIACLVQAGHCPEEVAVLTYERQRLRAIDHALSVLGVPTSGTQRNAGASGAGVRLMTMHSAKGLEFETVFVTDLSADRLPNPRALDAADGAVGRAESLLLQRNLLHVCMTRATHRLHLSWVGQPSPFLAPAFAILDAPTGELISEVRNSKVDSAGFRQGIANRCGSDRELDAERLLAEMTAYLNTDPWIKKRSPRSDGHQGTPMGARPTSNTGGV